MADAREYRRAAFRHRLGWWLFSFPFGPCEDGFAWCNRWGQWLMDEKPTDASRG